MCVTDIAISCLVGEQTLRFLRFAPLRRELCTPTTRRDASFVSTLVPDGLSCTASSDMVSGVAMAVSPVMVAVTISNAFSNLLQSSPVFVCSLYVASGSRGGSGVRELGVYKPE
jgi:hypothetical protein